MPHSHDMPDYYRRRCKPTFPPNSKGTPDGLEAEAILRKCVHCGFCTATCPTYQLLGDELDGPRGRIYLMKQVLEGARPRARPSCTWTAA
jgi:succinate dehydrogenase/fumarate reductase-like Fe-S protein